jgi:taurine dioxygenase
MTQKTLPRIDVKNANGAIGADILGVDFADLASIDITAIRSAWLARGVVRFPQCAIDDATHVAFARAFGELDFNPGTRLTGRIYIEGFPELVRVSNIVENGAPIGELGAGEANWHSDMCFIERPPSASLLRALEVPSSGGDTHFIDMVGILESLPPDLRRDIAGLSIKHDAIYASAGKQRAGTVAPTSGDLRDIPGAVHPIVQRHPETGLETLYLGKRYNAYVMGLEIADSEALLDRLWQYVSNASPQHLWTQKWRIGDMIMWDNRRTMHRRDAFDGAARRLLHRAVVKG